LLLSLLLSLLPGCPLLREPRGEVPAVSSLPEGAGLQDCAVVVNGGEHLAAGDA